MAPTEDLPQPLSTTGCRPTTSHQTGCRPTTSHRTGCSTPRTSCTTQALTTLTVLLGHLGKVCLPLDEVAECCNSNSLGCELLFAE